MHPAIASCRGLGRVRHVYLHIKFLWLQEAVACGRIKLLRVSGKDHTPDVGTKFLRAAQQAEA
eukprot:120599-Amphidinium_carterae.1